MHPGQHVVFILGLFSYHRMVLVPLGIQRLVAFLSILSIGTEMAARGNIIVDERQQTLGATISDDLQPDSTELFALAFHGRRYDGFPLCQRRWDKQVGSFELSIPKLRKGRYFPEWLLQPRRCSEKALVLVIVENYLKGVSTRRVEELVKAMGVSGISKSQVSLLTAEVDQIVEAFRQRPLQGPCVFLRLDAMSQRCRRNGRLVDVSVVSATAANADGGREVLGWMCSPPRTRRRGLSFCDPW